MSYAMPLLYTLYIIFLGFGFCSFSLPLLYTYRKLTLNRPIYSSVFSPVCDISCFMGSYEPCPCSKASLPKGVRHSGEVTDLHPGIPDSWSGGYGVEGERVLTETLMFRAQLRMPKILSISQELFLRKPSGDHSSYLWSLPINLSVY